MKARSLLMATKPRHQALNNASEKLKLEILGSELDVVTRTRYLGAQVDNSLDTKELIKAISSKVSRAIISLKYAINILPISSVKALYTRIEEAHFCYCCVVLGCCGTSNINQLPKLQNRAARILMESTCNSPIETLIDRFGWKTIRELVDQESKLMVY